MSKGNGFKRVGECSLFICTKTLTGSYGQEVVSLLEEAMKDLSVYEGKCVALDLFNQVEWENDFLRLILPVIKKLKSEKIDFYCINAPKSVVKFIKQEGVDSVISIEKTIEEVKAKYADKGASKKAPKLDLGFTNPFIYAAINTMQTQSQIEAKPMKPKLKQNLFDEDTDVAAVLDFKNESFRFYIALSFSKEMAFALVEKMLDEKYEEINDDIIDCIFETLNIVFGQSKPQLAPFGFDISSATPKAVHGDQIAPYLKQSMPTLSFRFKTELGSFKMEFAVTPLQETAQAA
tara:strand:+ start:8686 stop:9558 length:873 start_codon:yes stop_codon:yes gene_type:complete